MEEINAKTFAKTTQITKWAVVNRPGEHISVRTAALHTKMNRCNPDVDFHVCGTRMEHKNLLRKAKDSTAS
jgi:hypothetical protein